MADIGHKLSAAVLHLAELIHHGVEGLGEFLHLRGGFRLRHTHGKVTLGHGTGRTGQASQRFQHVAKDQEQHQASQQACHCRYAGNRQQQIRRAGFNDLGRRLHKHRAQHRIVLHKGDADGEEVIALDYKVQFDFLALQHAAERIHDFLAVQGFGKVRVVRIGHVHVIHHAAGTVNHQDVCAVFLVDLRSLPLKILLRVC